MKLEISECIEVDTKILIEEYGQLLTESSKKSIIKNNYKFKGDTKDSVIAQLENQFESVKVISKKGRYGGTTFELKGFKGLVEYERENKGGRPSLDWTNELLVIRELINKEVALGQKQEFYRGFTINQLLNKLLGFNKYEIEDIVKYEVQNHDIFTLSGNKDDYYGLKETVNNLIRNQRHIYVATIEKEIKKTNHIISFFDSNGEEIDVERYEEYMIFKNKLSSEIQVENNKEKELKNEYFKADMRTKVFKVKTIIEIEREVDNAVQEKFGFKYAYRLFTIFDEIQVGGEGDIDKVRESFYNRVMKNANSSQSKHEQTKVVKMNEKVYYRLVHSGLYVQVMDSVFSQLIVESKMIYTVEEDPEAKQRHLDGLERYMAEQRLEQEEEFYNQDDYVDVDRILYEMENPISDEECEERYFELIEY